MTAGPRSGEPYPRTTRRKKAFIAFIMIAIVGLLGIGLWLTQRQLSKAPAIVGEITVGAYAGDTGSLIFIAQEYGYFATNGLDVTVKEYEAGKLAADALLSDDVQIATCADFVFVSDHFDVAELRVLGTVATADINALIARKDREIQQPSDLKGKNIGVTRKSVGEFFLGTFLLFHDLSFGDVDIVDLRPSGLVEAISNGEIDAALTWEPNIYEIRNRLGENAVSWSGQSSQDFYFVLIAKEEWIKTHPAAVERFLNALVQAEAFVQKNNEDAQEFIEHRFNYDAAYLQYVWQKHRFVVKLPQTLLLVMEDEARWRIANNLTDKTEVPNYLESIYLTGMQSVKPEAITIIR